MESEEKLNHIKEKENEYYSKFINIHKDDYRLQTTLAEKRACLYNALLLAERNLAAFESFRDATIEKQAGIKAYKRVIEYLNSVNIDGNQQTKNEVVKPQNNIVINTDEIKEIDLAIALWYLCKDSIKRLHPDTFVNKIKDAGLIILSGTKKKNETDRTFSAKKYQNLKTYLSRMQHPDYNHKSIDENIQELIEKLKPILIDYTNK